MLPFFLRYVELLVMMLAIAWFASDPGWEPIITFLIALGLFLQAETTVYRRAIESAGVVSEHGTAQREADLDLFEQLLELLPSKGVIKFIDEFNMAGGSFKLDRLAPLDKFIHTWDDAEHEFLSPELEELRKFLLAAARQYLDAIGQFTSPNTVERQSVPPHWELEHPDRFDEAVSTLHTRSESVVDAHQRLVRLGRTTLFAETPRS